MPARTIRIVWASDAASSVSTGSTRIDGRLNTVSPIVMIDTPGSSPSHCATRRIRSVPVTISVNEIVTGTLLILLVAQWLGLLARARGRVDAERDRQGDEQEDC